MDRRPPPEGWMPAKRHATGDGAAPACDAAGDVGASGQTDFGGWTDVQLAAFLDARGDEGDAGEDRAGLLARAVACERSTGPAPPPSTYDGGGDDEADPLDAFMADINATAARDVAEAREGGRGGGGGRQAAGRDAARLALDDDDAAADYVAARAAAGPDAMQAAAAAASAAARKAGYGSDDEDRAVAAAVDAAAGRGGGDADDDSASRLAGTVPSLTPANHEAAGYAPFNKDLYEPAPEIAALSPADVAARRTALGVWVAGCDVPAPVQSFAQCGFDDVTAAAVAKAGYERPTPIQAQAIPVALAGRDVLGIATTGSGKTAAFVLPMVVHCMDQPELGPGDGPIAILASPTHELAEQTHREARRFGRPHGLRCVAAFGGLSMHAQVKALRAGAEVAVVTPGRAVGLIKAKALCTRRVTYVVLDEADRMFDLGFEPQLRSLLGQIRPDRQTLLFSATMPPRVEALAASATTAPVRITVGARRAAAAGVRQVVQVLDEANKPAWLAATLPGFVDGGDVVVFAATKARVDDVLARTLAAGVKAVGLHGDLDQAARSGAVKALREGGAHVLVATDVAARGLDLRGVRTVVSYDAPRDADTHVHRVGRTGRAGDADGVAYTLVTPGEGRAAGALVASLVAGGQDVPAPLARLAAGQAKRGGGGRRGGGRGRGRGRGAAGPGLGFGSEAGEGKGGGSAARAPPPAGGFVPSSGRPTASPAAGGNAPSSRTGGAPVMGGRFVSSGVVGGGVQKVEISAPKRPPARAVPPPPVPVAARAAACVSGPGLDAARAAAQAIAARLAAGAAAGGGAGRGALAWDGSHAPPGTGLPPPPPPPPAHAGGDPVERARQAAQAIAARLAAQHAAGGRGGAAGGGVPPSGRWDR